ncbi:ABC transporter A family member 2 [Spinacia oleracea]|uniref:ABC transporter A family member 2 n=1 Tax=Spinacia oleracea TaxID=3562 RepID=A0ABM3QSX1_SPIOL|nr:ABC transporter A family member 2-like [Spinacia oleracea]
MEIQSGIPLLMQQIKALVKKNMWLAGRKKTALYQLFFLSFFYIFLMFAMEKMNDAINKSYPENRDMPDPSYNNLLQPIPQCEEFSVRQPCYDFVWSGESLDSKRRVQRIVDAIMANNPGRPIPPAKVKSFGTQKETDAWFLDNPARSPGALHIVDRNTTVISYGIQPNSSVLYIVPFQQIFLKFQIPLQIAAEREIARTLIGDQSFNWTVGMKPFAHPAAKKLETQLFSVLGKACLLLITAQVFQNQLTNLVIEKEQKLRQAMNIMGLYDSAYWLSWLTWEIIMTFLVSLFTTIVGLCFRFPFFTRNNFLLLFLAMYLNLLSMTSIAFLASTFLSQSRSASQATIYVIFGGFILQFVAKIMKENKIVKILKHILPVIPFSSAIDMLTTSASSRDDPGMSWKGRNNCPDADQEGGEECDFTMDGIYIRLIGSFFLWLFVALYFDNILPNENGIPKSPFYFLNPGYWTGRGGFEALESGLFGSKSWLRKPEMITPDDEDVLEEENNIKKMMDGGRVDPDVAVQVQGLVKTYPGKLDKKFKRSPPFHSVKGLWVNFPKDQLFCLLGHNGAGKTTTINCLTGITPVSGGDALIYEHSVRSSVGMSNIRKIIGVCPQFDILWNVLSGEEHLELFCNIKGLTPDSIPTIVHKLLEDVQLAKSAKVRSGSYSGGMRRRLSVAAALIGDPKLVILDEPTTGMDPLTRRHVWDIIESSKRGRAIVLTTHSMEEADVLSDRIGIMAKGRLRCIGTPIRLKMRFGTGFVANMNFGNNADETGNRGRENLKQLFKRQLNVEPMEENKSYTTYVIPRDKELLLKKTFGEVQDRQSEFGITDIQLGLATLEEVFLNIAKQEEMESAAAEGRFVTLSLTSGPSIQIPVGARFVGIPGTESAENPQGIMVEVYWGQDDSGAPEILGHSPEKPIPPGLNVTLPKSTTTELQGIVIHPSQVSDECFS